MSANQFRRAPAALAIALAFGLSVGLAAVSPAQAAGLGKLNVQSALGQPLRAELEVNSVSADEAPTLSVKLASPAAYRAANVEYSPGLSNLRFSLEQKNGAHVVRISSAQAVNEPYLDLLIEVTWATGRVVREYTVLLDPPALRQPAEIVAPAVPRAAAPKTEAAPSAPAARPAEAKPGPAPGAKPTPQVAAKAEAKPTKPDAAKTYTVKRGDTLYGIAERSLESSVALDQMLVALFRANPAAFSGNNMNRLAAGAVLSIPAAGEAAAIPAAEASREIRAHSADFAAYRSRLAKAVAAAPTAAAAPAPSTAASGGQVSAKVEDKSAAAKAGGDQLKIAKAQDGKATPAAAADERAAREREVKELESRLAQLNKTNEELKQAIELQSKAGAQAQKQAEAKTAAPVADAAKPAAAAVEVAKPEAVATKADAAPAAAEAAQPAAPAEAKAEPKPEPKSEAKPATPPAPPPAEEPSFIGEMLGNTSTQLGLGAIVALLAGLFGWSAYRRKKAEQQAAFQDGSDGLGANSLFGHTGGQSVDTSGTASTFNSSFMPAAAPLDSNEVDPVAEADVYIAYGREEQAEDILKEALRQQPDRHAVRGKLLEIYARRGDQASFNALAKELHERTAGVGEEWESAAKLGRSLDPSNALYAGAAAASLAAAAAGPITNWRIPAEAKSAQSELSGILEPTAMPGVEAITTAPPLTRMEADSSPTVVLDDATPVAAAAPELAPLDFAPRTAEAAAPMTVFSMPTEDEPALAVAESTQPPLAAGPSVDFDSLDFDLGPTAQPREEPAAVELEMPSEPEVATPSPEPEALRFDLDLDIPSIQPVPAPVEPALEAPTFDVGLSDFEHTMPPLAQALSADSISDIDLDLDLPAEPARRLSSEELLGQPTLVGMMGALPDEGAQRLNLETDQATVPLIDFDLSAVSLDAAGKSGETEPGSALAQQMATKLDLARGYIDLGVRDGARELLDEVVRDGTREQRSAAVELIKQIEA